MSSIGAALQIEIIKLEFRLQSGWQVAAGLDGGGRTVASSGDFAVVGGGRSSEPSDGSLGILGLGSKLRRVHA